MYLLIWMQSIQIFWEDEKAWLNAYHKQVYDIIAPHLTKEEEEWLRIYTREI